MEQQKDTLTVDKGKTELRPFRLNALLLAKTIIMK